MLEQRESPIYTNAIDKRGLSATIRRVCVIPRFQTTQYCLFRCRERRANGLIALRAFLLISLFSLALSSNTGRRIWAAGEIDKGHLHGGIEIDPEGIKAAVIQVPDADPGAGAKVVFTEEFNVALRRDQDGRFTQEVVKTAARAIQEYHTIIRQQYEVPAQQIYVIGSSDFDASDLEELAKEVRSNIGAGIAFLSAESEARLNVIGTIPRRYREGETWFDNRSQSVVIDIGSIKTKGAYQQYRQPLVGAPYYDFVAVEIPTGTANFTDEINRAAGENAGVSKFATSARALSGTSIKAPLRSELKKKPGLAHRKKIYLNGAIVRAMMTLLYPDDRRPLVQLTAEDIEVFHERALTSPQALLNPNLSRIRSDEIRKEAEKELEAVKISFTPKNLIAGAEILKSIASECNFQEEGKKIFYARFSNMSLISSYLLLRAGDGPPQP
jgi:Ppx/GppA phosphatase family